MKNLLIHLHPSKRFDEERNNLVRIQIDSALQLGWNPSNIWLITNFEYQYNGVKAMVIDDNNYCDFKPRSTNTVVVPHLFELGMIEQNEVYWVHDLDAYQQYPITEEELDLNVDIGFTTYGWPRKPFICLGSFFFKDESWDVFRRLKETIYCHKLEDESALELLLKDIKPRYKLLNITYNFGMRFVEDNYERAKKPIKVVHFHPSYHKGKLKPLDIFMCGKSGLGFPLMTPELIEIFRVYGYGRHYDYLLDSK